MFATTREAFLSRACGILEVVDVSFNALEFYKKHAGTDGCRYVTLDKPVDDDWARDVIDDAMTYVRREDEEG